MLKATNCILQLLLQLASSSIDKRYSLSMVAVTNRRRSDISPAQRVLQYTWFELMRMCNATPSRRTASTASPIDETATPLHLIKYITTVYDGATPLHLIKFITPVNDGATPLHLIKFITPVDDGDTPLHLK